MKTPAFSIGQTVQTFDKGFEPDVSYGTTGTITEIVKSTHTDEPTYNVDVKQTDGYTANLFFFESELKKVAP